MSENPAALPDRDYPCDIRVFRARARAERRRTRAARSDRARQVHAEMAEHYEMVAKLLETRDGQHALGLTRALRRMLERLLPP